MRDKETVAAMIKGERARTIANISARTERPGCAWWLSFADDEGFRGALIIHANDFREAVMEANLRGLNPHGECKGLEVPAAMAALIPEEWKYRLLSRNDCEQFDKEMEAIKSKA